MLIGFNINDWAGVFLDLEKLKSQLLIEKMKLEESLQKIKQIGLEESMVKSVEELSNYDNHPADLGSEMFEREKDFALQESMRNRLLKVDEALKRIEEGNYGYCLECGRLIPQERLEALPSTIMCLECKSQKEVEDTHFGPVKKEQLEIKQGTNQDKEEAWHDVARFGEHAQGSRAGAYYGDEDLNEPDGTIEDVERFPYFKDKDGMFYEDLRDAHGQNFERYEEEGGE